MWEGLKIGGFQFDDSMEYALAKKESDIIGYITERMNTKYICISVFDFAKFGKNILCAFNTVANNDCFIFMFLYYRFCI